MPWSHTVQLDPEERLALKLGPVKRKIRGAAAPAQKRALDERAAALRAEVERLAAHSPERCSSLKEGEDFVQKAKERTSATKQCELPMLSQHSSALPYIKYALTMQEHLKAAQVDQRKLAELGWQLQEENTRLRAALAAVSPKPMHLAADAERTIQGLEEGVSMPTSFVTTTPSTTDEQAEWIHEESDEDLLTSLILSPPIANELLSTLSEMESQAKAAAQRKLLA